MVYGQELHERPVEYNITSFCPVDPHAHPVFARSLSIDPHDIYHMYGVYSSDAGLILSSIEIIWYLGQN
jgi:hypothetical protein